MSKSSALTEALATLQEANDNLNSFLEGAAENEAVAAEIAVDEPTPAQIDTALDTALTNTTAAVDAELVSISGITANDFIDAGDNTKAGLIADGRKDAQDAIDTAQKAVSDYKAEIAKVDGLASAIATATAAANNLEAAQEAQAEALDSYAGVLTTFEARNEAADGDLANDADVVLQKSDGAGGFAEWDPAADGVDTLLRVQDASTNDTTLFTVTDGKLSVENGLDAYTGLDALQSSIQAVVDATSEVNSATTANTSAVNALAEFAFDDGDFDGADLGLSAGEDGTDVFATLQSNETDLEDAQEAQQDLNDAIASWESVVELDSERTDLEKVVTDAQEAIEGEDGLNVDLREDGTNFTTEDEVYLFDAEDGAQTLSGFGANGEDRIFFGDGFALVELEGDAADEFVAADFSADVGAESDLEIFWAQDGNDLQLFVENKAFAGNSTSGDDFTQITLTGVSAADIEFSGGYLTAGEPA